MINYRFSKTQVILIIVALTILGGALRIYDNTENPPSLNIDEVSFGYNAYSILQTGRDEHGVFMPLSFKSVGDYKNPLPIYLLVPFISVFGLNEFSVRMPTAIIATLSIPLFFVFFQKLVGKRSVALVSTILLTLSPWHIYYARYAAENTIAMSLIIAATLLFLKFKDDKNIIIGLLSGLLFALSMYTYYAERLFVPLLVAILVILFRVEFKLRYTRLILFLTGFSIISLPMVISSIWGVDSARAQMTCICNDIEFTRNVLLSDTNQNSLYGMLQNNSLLFFYGIRKFLNYASPTFLFYNSLGMTVMGTYGLGVMYLFEMPLLTYGVLSLFKINSKVKVLVLSWLILGLFPAAVTLNEQHPGRTINILPMLIFLSGLGGVELIKVIKLKFSNQMRLSTYALLGGLIIWSFAQAFLIFRVHFPIERGEAFMEGTKQTVEYALEHNNQYSQIVFDPTRGLDGPYIVSIPHMYVLFYSKYDPAVYQKENKRKEDNIFGFDKYRFRSINWRADQNKTGVLFIGSPWSIPEKDLKPNELLKKVYLTNGQVAFLIVSPQP